MATESGKGGPSKGTGKSGDNPAGSVPATPETAATPILPTPAETDKQQTSPPSRPPAAASDDDKAPVTRGEIRSLLDVLSGLTAQLQQNQAKAAPPPAAGGKRTVKVPAGPDRTPRSPTGIERAAMKAAQAKAGGPKAEAGDDPGDEPTPASMPEGGEGGGDTPVPQQFIGSYYAADVICGKEGSVVIGATELPEITMWSFNPTITTQSYASNKTNGFKRKVCGSKDATGSLEGKWDRTDPITDHFTEGSTVTLLLHLDTTRKITVPALITGMTIEVNIDDNEIEGWTADFEADGEWTYAIA
jgi:hypothetical protein